MPEDLPKAVLVLLWLLIGLIVLGYLIMDYPLVYSIVFALVYYGGTVFFYLRRNKHSQ